MTRSVYILHARLTDLDCTDQLECAREEVMAIALERYVVPHVMQTRGKGSG
jgi:hypothetical protein